MTMKNTRQFLAAAILLVVLAVPAIATAYTVQGTVFFWDSRTDRSDNYGSRLPQHTSTDWNKRATGIFIKVYDKDGTCIDFASSCSETDDDFLAFDLTDSSGFYSVSGIGGLEDVYLVTNYSVSNANVQTVSLSTPITVEVATTDWVEDIGRDTWINWNVTCYASYLGDRKCDSESEADDDFPLTQALANVAISAEDTLVQNGSVEYNYHFDALEAFWPNDPWGGCDDSAGHATGWDTFCVANNVDDNNHVTAHEIGHLVMKRLLDDGSGSLGEGSCRNYWDWNDLEFQKCTVTEGWADFYAGAAYWEPDSSSPWVDFDGQELEGDTESANGGSAEACVSIGDTPHARVGNVARWFWDLYDTTTVGTGETSNNDNASYSMETIKIQWDDFPRGTDNREARESDDNGRNARDLTYYAGGFVSERDLNCLSGQSDW